MPIAVPMYFGFALLAIPSLFALSYFCYKALRPTTHALAMTLSLLVRR